MSLTIYRFQGVSAVIKLNNHLQVSRYICSHQYQQQHTANVTTSRPQGERAVLVLITICRSKGERAVLVLIVTIYRSKGERAVLELIITIYRPEGTFAVSVAAPALS